MADQNTAESSKESSTPIKAKRKYTRKASKKVAQKSFKKTSKKVPKGKSWTGNRYSQEIKDKVVAFVKSNPGRGVIKAAMKEFGISYISLKNWLKKEEIQVQKAVKGVVNNVKAKGRGRAKGSSKGAGGDFDSIVAEIQQKRAEIKELLKLLSNAG